MCQSLSLSEEIEKREGETLMAETRIHSVINCKFIAVA